MTIKAGGRVALTAAAGLLVFVCGVSWTQAASDAAETTPEQVSTSKKVKQVRYYKRYAHRKHGRLAQKSSEQKKPAETGAAEAGLPVSLPASVANANARMGDGIADDAARAMTARANALLSEQPAEGQGAVTMQVVEADQLNDSDKALQEPAPPSQTTVAVAPVRPAVQAKPVVQETSTWDQTSLIGKIFIAFGALLTIASAARMFMA